MMDIDDRSFRTIKENRLDNLFPDLEKLRFRVLGIATSDTIEHIMHAELKELHITSTNATYLNGYLPLEANESRTIPASSISTLRLGEILFDSIPKLVYMEISGLVMGNILAEAIANSIQNHRNLRDLW